MTVIARCVRDQQDIVDTIDLIFIATLKYNQTLVKSRPIDIVNSFSKEKLYNIMARLKAADRDLLLILRKDQRVWNKKTDRICFYYSTNLILCIHKP